MSEPDNVASLHTYTDRCSTEPRVICGLQQRRATHHSAIVNPDIQPNTPCHGRDSALKRCQRTTIRSIS